jgi:hypothetical protein
MAVVLSASLLMLIGCGKSDNFKGSFISVVKGVSLEGEQVMQSIDLILSLDNKLIKKFRNSEDGIILVDMLDDLEKETLFIDYRDDGEIELNKAYSEGFGYAHFVNEASELILRTNYMDYTKHGFDAKEYFPTLKFLNIPDREGDRIVLNFSYVDAETGGKVYEIIINRVVDEFNVMTPSY